MEASPELACRLTTPDLARRLDDLRSGLFRQITAVSWQSTGAEFAFPATDQVVTDLLDFVRFERQCCPFLTFSLHLPAGESQARLRLDTNTTEGGAFIRTTFGSLLPKGHIS